MTDPHYTDDAVTLYHGDCLDVLRQLDDNSVDAVVTDPPYGLEFMGKEWDDFSGDNRQPFRGEIQTPDNPYGRSTVRFSGAASYGGKHLTAMRQFQDWCELWSIECLRVLKPGGHMLAFGGSRTWHRLASAIEDAGFEIRDSIAWLYGSGFSKGGLLGNKPGLEWCECEGANAVPYNHADNADLPRVRDDIHPPTVARGEGQDGLLLAEVQRGGEGPRVGEARAQGPRSMVAGGRGLGGGEDDRIAESGMGGRFVHRAEQGLPDDPQSGAHSSASERVRGRAPAGDGGDDRATGDAARGGASRQPRPLGQSAGEPEALPGSHESLDDRARRGRVGCPRCGGLDPAFRGFSTTLKPAHEPIVVARKPLTGTVAANVLAHGTGALNIDATRIGDGADKGVWPVTDRTRDPGWGMSPEATTDVTRGRWPANVILDQSQADQLDKQSGERPSSGGAAFGDRSPGAPGAFAHGGGNSGKDIGFGDTGGASRFFYQAKADANERPRAGQTSHPTVKPLDLMRWLVRLVTPPGGTVLDPFAGSGTTAEACIIEHFRCITIERDDTYLPLIVARLTKPIQVGLDFGGDIA